MKTIYYFDMDGVLANFNAEPKAVSRFKTEKGFFYKLQPIKRNIELIYELIEKGEKVRILSASPNKRADKDKRKWLKKYVPIIKRKNIIFCRLGDNKADYANKKNINILLDDYSVNCREWTRRGENFKAIKVGDSPIDL